MLDFGPDKSVNHSIPIFFSLFLFIISNFCTKGILKIYPNFSLVRKLLISMEKKPSEGLELVILLHCRKKIGDVLIVSEQVRIICRPLGIRIDQFVEH